MFQATNEELAAFYANRQWNAIQWHGMSADTCPDAEVYLSHGLNSAPSEGSKITQLRSELLRIHPLWKAAVPGSNSCTLSATANVQGRLLNGVDADSVCSLDSGVYKDVFIHIEQDPNFRNPADWIEAINNNWAPQSCTPAAPPLDFVSRAGDAAVSLSWSSVLGASVYNVKRSLASGGPYTILSTVNSIEYTDSAVSNGNTYYYVVSGINSCGEGSNSAEASTTPRLALPSAPIALKLTVISKSKISLNWQDTSNNEDSFKIERSRDGISFSEIATTGSNTQSYLNTNLKSSSTYYYRVKALNGSGASPYSNTAQATTP